MVSIKKINLAFLYLAKVYRFLIGLQMQSCLESGYTEHKKNYNFSEIHLVEV